MVVNANTIPLTFVVIFQVSQERDRQKGIDTLSFAILAWIAKRSTFGVKPKSHVWPHIQDTNLDYKKLRKECALHFGIDMDNKAGASGSFIFDFHSQFLVKQSKIMV